MNTNKLTRRVLFPYLIGGGVSVVGCIGDILLWASSRILCIGCSNSNLG